jgi:hypothetical protein
MARRSIVALILLGSCWLCLAARAADPEAAIDAESALARVRTLASDEFQGRGSGEPGGRRAGEWIFAELEAMGLRPRWQRFRSGALELRNVVVRIPGRDRARGEEHVVLGAHYDHVGRGEAGGALDKNGPIHNGADDNASGSAALLEIAEAMALAGPRSRSVVLVWFDGEERGLQGSQHYVSDPDLPLEKCVAMINFDMVGRLGGRAVQVIAANSGTGLCERALRQAPACGLRADVVPYMVPNSDHWSFYRKRVPVVFFCTGLHADYHRATDDWEKIDARGIAEVARLGYRMARELADEPIPVAWAPVHMAPIGVMALEYLEGLTGSGDFDDLGRSLYGPIEGAFVGFGIRLEVDYVTPGSAAERAGLRAGDTILRAGKVYLFGPFARRALVRAIGEARRGKAVALKIEVRREGRRLALELPLGGAERAGQRVF